MSKTENDIRFSQMGEKFRELRKNAGYSSHEEFAYDNNLQPKQVWRLESGNFDFKVSTLFRMLNIHGITLEEFFNGLK